MTESKKQKRILVAEDEKPMAKALQLKLESEDFIVDVAFDGGEAIAKIDELAKGNTMYDLAMIDVMMPKANGFTVLEHIKKEKIKIPSIFILSNLSQAKDVKKAKDLGASEFVIKSNTPINEIISKVKSYI
jgi:CheY-like chemotaxis protein